MIQNGAYLHPHTMHKRDIFLGRNCCKIESYPHQNLAGYVYVRSGLLMGWTA